MSGRILIVDDDRDMCGMLETDLGARGFEPASRSSGKEALAAMTQEDYDVVLTDLKMPDMDGIELCRAIQQRWADVPVIVITAFGSMDAAIQAIRAGAYDFVTKPIELDQLEVCLARALERHTLQERVKVLTEVIERSERFGELLGTSPVMLKLYDQISRIAATDTSVLITGESGSGKELIAREFHKRSPRCDGPFVAINCAAIPETLMESELFGHEKGAFTDAKTARKGLFLQANGGTIFLDEIGEVPLSIQPKLLRALEERTARPIGGNREVSFDVRLVSATNRNLEETVESGRFREDLYYRINVIQLEVPPLRNRGHDILLLAQHFLKTFAARMDKHVSGISEAVARKLLDYNWPGNVRELANAMERSVVLARHERLVVTDLPSRVQRYRATSFTIDSTDVDQLVPMDEIEQRYVLHVLKAVAGNRTAAAKVLGFDRKTLYRKLLKYGVPDEENDKTRQ